MTSVSELSSVAKAYTPSSTRGWQAKAALGARIGLGAIFFVFGLNGLWRFLPMPAMDPASATYIQGLLATGYIMPLVKVIEVAASLMLLSNRFVRLALVLLAPIVVNIAIFHVGIAHNGYPMVALIIAAGSYLAWWHRDAYRGVLAPV